MPQGCTKCDYRVAGCHVAHNDCHFCSAAERVDRERKLKTIVTPSLITSRIARKQALPAVVKVVVVVEVEYAEPRSPRRVDHGVVHREQLSVGAPRYRAACVWDSNDGRVIQACESVALGLRLVASSNVECAARLEATHRLYEGLGELSHFPRHLFVGHRTRCRRPITSQIAVSQSSISTQASSMPSRTHELGSHALDPVGSVEQYPELQSPSELHPHLCVCVCVSPSNMDE